MKAWLLPRNLTLVSVMYFGELQHVLDALSVNAPDAFCVLTGRSRAGVQHSVVVRRGRIVNDPHPGLPGLLGQALDFSVFERGRQGEQILIAWTHQARGFQHGRQVSVQLLGAAPGQQADPEFGRIQ